MSRVLVVGRSGQVARALAVSGWPEGIALECRGREAIDLARPGAAAEAIAARRPDLVVNAAAYTAVDKAESENEAAFAINRDGPAGLAEGCARLGIPLIHLSTDYVFDGRKSDPYVEDDPVNPLSVYGASKEAGERAVRQRLADHIILRSSWIYAAQGTNFVRTMLARRRQTTPLAIVDDQRGSPTAAGELARAVVAIAAAVLAGKGSFGTFHFSGAGSTSWFGFAEAIFELAGKPRPALRAISTAEYPTPARRPANSVLDGGKLRRLYGIEARPWRDSLAACLSEIAALEGKTA